MVVLFVLEDDDGHVTTAPKNAEDIMVEEFNVTVFLLH